jgi:hypothetical protein
VEVGPNTHYILSFQLPERCIVQGDIAVTHVAEGVAYNIRFLLPHSTVLHLTTI